MGDLDPHIYAVRSSFSILVINVVFIILVINVVFIFIQDVNDYELLIKHILEISSKKNRSIKSH